ncbi:uncharacterized protein LOC130590516 [Beta vulgaris subsp. vulgaris]|uniref:uncharacterized protein LOC130590516 n=1 Tax=Beta vulgaris subsp. vulgaris TaxID=3555 RepID=UPI00254765DF|nr:uncharacterized protein LOC130590516 [Beta vulgaris subsp. vulgaris]
MVDDKPVMEQVHVYENMCADFLNEDMKICEVFQANVLLEKFPLSRRELYNNPKHRKEFLSLHELISHMRIEEANRIKDNHDSVLVNVTKANLVETTAASSGSDKFKCKGKKVNNKGSVQKETPQANLVESDDIVDVVVAEANPIENNSDWILDTGTLRHFCSNKDLLHDFQDATEGECVYMDNAATAGVLGQGKVTLKFTSGKTLSL